MAALRPFPAATSIAAAASGVTGGAVSRAVSRGRQRTLAEESVNPVPGGCLPDAARARQGRAFRKEPAMHDDFASFQVSLTAPAIAAEMITPSDSTDLAFATRALYVGTGGTVRAVLVSGSEATFENLPSGSFCPLRIVRVLATGTTATGLVGLR